MKPRTPVVGVLLLFLAFLLMLVLGSMPADAYVDQPQFRVGPPAGSAGEGAARYVPDEIVVKFRGDTKPFRVIKVPEGKVPEHVASYSRRADVVYAEPNYYVHASWTPNDPFFSYQWHFGPTETGGINLEAAWDLTPRPTGDGVTVAIVDSGIAYENYWDPPDNFYIAPDLVGQSFAAGYDFINDDAHPNDDNGHGTHVAGTVAQATNNSTGVAGIAYNATLMPVKVLDEDGSGTTAGAAEGVYWAVDHGAQIINMSLGADSWTQDLYDAVTYAYNNGVTVVAATGNDGEGTLDYPAAYDTVIAVGATIYDKTLAYYSNWGAGLDVVAPGGDARSEEDNPDKYDQNGDGYPDGVLQNTFYGDPSDFHYYFFQGTSMATPHVAGVAALLIDQGIATTPDEIRYALQQTALDLGTAGYDTTFGWGLIDARAALEWEPTVAVVTSFGASVEQGRVAITWETAGEVGTAGYYVERHEPGTDGWVRVNDTMVPSFLESPTGGSYALVDERTDLDRANVMYRLVEVEADGGLRYHSPIKLGTRDSGASSVALRELKQGAKAARVAQAVDRSVGPPSGRSTGPVAVEAVPSDRLRIEVEEAALYRVEAVDIATALGVSSAEAQALIESAGLELTTGGRSVAYLPDGSSLYFYAEAIDSVYTEYNVYFLERGRGETMAVAAPMEPSGTVHTSFTDTLHVEENLWNFSIAFHDPEADCWMWDHLAPYRDANIDMTTRSFTFGVPDIAAAGGTLTVALHGLTTGGQAGEHQARVFLNGTELGSTSWSGQVDHEAVFSAAGALQDGLNTVTVQVGGGARPYSRFAVDSFDLTYERAFVPVGDQLELSLDEAGSVEVGGLSSTAGWVLDLADPSEPTLVPATPGQSGTSLCFEAGPGAYLVATVAGARRPEGLIATRAPEFDGMRAEYVIVTTPALADAAQRLASYRAGNKGGGLSTLVVTTSQIYDRFSHGIATPYAVRDFINYARAHWGTRYVLLAGEGSEDYKNYSGSNDCLVPSLRMDTDYGLAPSDVLLAETASTPGVPGVALGRLPVLTAAALDDALAKIKAYEAVGGPWRSRVLFAADDDDPDAGFFAADSDELGGWLPSSFSVNTAYLGQQSSEEVRADLFTAFDKGALVVNYMGHGGVSYLASERILTTTDVPALARSNRLPIFVALTCVVGHYGMPGYDTLSEALVLEDRSGAIAAWSPATMAENDLSAKLGAAFFRALGASGEQTLGNLTQAAYAGAAAEGVPASALRGYSLLGDPALQVRW